MSRHNRRFDRPPVVQPRPAVAPSAQVGQPVPEASQQFLVVIENLTSQSLEVSVLNEGGAVEGLRLDPRGKSRPVLHSRVGHYTHDLVARGRVQLVPQS